ncbi:MAG: NifU family protein [Candidatus Melainabacteria bacterium]|nr:NifU family protein [Candidatus Melainabacteria bacterium]MBI3308382.1 NifU family protein [Candidatus Melainabacteria bacterium]
MDSQEKNLKVYTEGTPNPNALKFVLDQTLLETGSASFTNKEKASNSPLAKKLFVLDSVKEILIGRNFITITKDQNVIWDSIYGKIEDIISKHFESGEPIITESNQQTTDNKKTTGDPVEEKIKEILDNQIRPAVASDGGDIIFDSYKDGILRLHLQGACSSCPSSIMTLKVGVEQMLKRQIPELKEVISI